MAVAPLIITAERNHYVDFSKPFMDMGLDILLAKETAETDIFYFFRPFRHVMPAATSDPDTASFNIYEAQIVQPVFETGVDSLSAIEASSI